MVANETNYEYCYDEDNGGGGGEQQQQQQEQRPIQLLSLSSSRQDDDVFQTSCIQIDKNGHCSSSSSSSSSSISSSSLSSICEITTNHTTTITNFKSLRSSSLSSLILNEPSLLGFSNSSSFITSTPSKSKSFKLMNSDDLDLAHHQQQQQHYRLKQYPRFFKTKLKLSSTSSTSKQNGVNNNKKPLKTDFKTDFDLDYHRGNSIKTKSMIDSNNKKCEDLIEPSAVIRFLCYFSYFILIIFGYFRMLMEWLNLGNYNSIVEKNRKGYRPLYNSWQAFFTRYIYRRVADIFSIPITGNPGGIVTVLDRKSSDHNFTFQLTGEKFQCINLASYDYLGFSRQSSNDPDIERVIRKYSIGVNPIHELGQLDLHKNLEEIFAKFLQVESCMIFGMGFATNSTNIPSLADDNCLIIADERSHASAKSGIYLSKAKYQYFKHNDCDDLEKRIRKAIINGNNGKPWKKIIIIVEGVYSMEGTIVNLPRLIQLKKRYKCYLYVDEAHSIGAVGPNGRGIVDYFHCNPNDVDLLMGTMTKSFAASGGYLAGKRNVIDHIRMNSMSNYAGSISPPIIQQIINTVQILSKQNSQDIVDSGTEDSEGQRRIRQLLSNTHYMRDALKQLGFIISGHYDSPVIPIMIYIPAKIGSIVRMAIRNGLALVCAGYPATSLTTNRIRLCMTAEHSKETLDKAIQILSMIGDVHHIKYQNYGVL